MKKVFIYILFLIFFLRCIKENKEIISSKPLKFTDNEIVNYVEYCNDRFHLCIDYPSSFRALPEPTNGDGRGFINEADSATITVYGFIDSENNGLENYISITKKLVNIKTINKIEPGILIKGIEKNTGFIYYEKIILKSVKNTANSGNKSSNIIGTLQLIFPKEKNEKYSKLWSVINKNFK